MIDLSRDMIYIHAYPYIYLFVYFFFYYQVVVWVTAALYNIPLILVHTTTDLEIPNDYAMYDSPSYTDFDSNDTRIYPFNNNKSTSSYSLAELSWQQNNEIITFEENYTLSSTVFHQSNDSEMEREDRKFDNIEIEYDNRTGNVSKTSKKTESGDFIGKNSLKTLSLSVLDKSIDNRSLDILSDSFAQDYNFDANHASLAGKDYLKLPLVDRKHITNTTIKTNPSSSSLNDYFNIDSTKLTAEDVFNNSMLDVEVQSAVLQESDNESMSMYILTFCYREDGDDDVYRKMGIFTVCR